MSDGMKDRSAAKDPYEELKRIVKEVEQKGEEASERAREATGTGQYMADFARATEDAIPYLPPTDIENLMDPWTALNQQADILLVNLRNVSLVIRSTDSTAGTVSLSTTGTFMGTDLLPNDPNVISPEAQAAIKHLHSVAARMADASKVEELLKQLGLNKAPKGRKNALQQFQTAHRAFENPVIKGDPSSTSLIPMRECIETVIATMIKRCPYHEKTGNERAKILFIGRHLKRDSLSLDIINTLADQWHEINNKDLSSSKQQFIDRKEWSRRLQRATQFLFSLLSGLDPTRMKGF